MPHLVANEDLRGGLIFSAWSAARHASVDPRDVAEARGMFSISAACFCFSFCNYFLLNIYIFCFRFFIFRLLAIFALSSSLPRFLVSWAQVHRLFLGSLEFSVFVFVFPQPKSCWARAGDHVRSVDGTVCVVGVNISRRTSSSSPSSGYR